MLAVCLAASLTIQAGVTGALARASGATRARAEQKQYGTPHGDGCPRMDWRNDGAARHGTAPYLQRSSCSVETEHEQRVAMYLYLSWNRPPAATAAWPAVGLERHWRRVDSGASLERPQTLAGERVVGAEHPVALAGEEHVALGHQAAADHRLLGLGLPGDVAGVDVDGRDVAHCCSPGMATNAEPSQSLPCCHSAVWVM